MTGRRPPRNLGLGVFDPDISSDEELPSLITQRPSSSTQPSPKLLPTTPCLGYLQSLSSQQQQQLPEWQSPAQQPLRQLAGLARSASSTPRSSTPPVKFSGGVLDDRDLDSLSLSVTDESGPTQRSYSHPRQGPYKSQSMNVSSSRFELRSAPIPIPSARNQEGSVNRLIITATVDAENLHAVDITGVAEPALIRERIFQKLHIPCGEYDSFGIFRTELGERALGDIVSNDQLRMYCEKWADARGTLKFLVQHITPPPPQSISPFTLPQSSLFAPFQQPSSFAPLQPPVTSPPLPAVSAPPSYSSAYNERGETDARTSNADRNRDRAPWDGVSNGYQGDVDGKPRRRHSSPPPIDTTARRRREPSASSSDYNFSPTSPQGTGSLPPPASMSPLINIPVRRAQPRHSLGTSGPSTFLTPQTPGTHRRRESETAAKEHEQALEASERLRENQMREYDSQYRRRRVERERQTRRQGPFGQGDGSIQPVAKSQRSDSFNSGSGAPHGWVIVNEVFPNGPTSDPASASNSGFGPPSRSTSFSGFKTTGTASDNWMAFPPAESLRFSSGPNPTGGLVTQSSSRPHQPYATTPSAPVAPVPRPPRANDPTMPLQRPHPPLPFGKYPNPHPYPRIPQQYLTLPPGALDPRMRKEIERQSPAVVGNPSSFYATGIQSAYSNAPLPPLYNSGGGPPSSSGSGSGSSSGSRMLEPNGGWQESSENGGDGGGLRPPRSLSDLRQFSSTSPALRTGVAAPSRQGGLDASPSSFYSGFPPSLGEGGMTRSSNTPGDYASGVVQSLSISAGLFSGGMLADTPLGGGPPAAERARSRSKQSYDRLSAFDRTMAAHREPPPPVPSLPMSVANQQTPGWSYRYGWMSNTANSPAVSSSRLIGVDSDTMSIMNSAKSFRRNTVLNPQTEEESIATASENDNPNVEVHFEDNQEDEDDVRFWNTPAALPPSINVTSKDANESPTSMPGHGEGPLMGRTGMRVQVSSTSSDGGSQDTALSPDQTSTPSQGTPTSPINVEL